MTVRPCTLAELLRRDLEIAADLDRIRDGLVESLACTEGTKGHKALLRAHTRGEKLRRELLHCWYAEPRADAPPLTEEPRADVP